MFKALTDAAKDFEAALTAAPSTTSTTSNRTNSPKPKISTNSTTTNSTNSINSPSSPSTSSISSSPIVRSESPATTAELADQAISNLRNSIRKNRPTFEKPKPEVVIPKVEVVVEEPKKEEVAAEVVEEIPVKEEKVVEPIVEEEVKVEVTKESVEPIIEKEVEVEKLEEEAVEQVEAPIVVNDVTEVEAPLSASKKKKNKKKNKNGNGNATAEATPEEPGTRSTSPIPDTIVEVEVVPVVPEPEPEVEVEVEVNHKSPSTETTIPIDTLSSPTTSPITSPSPLISTDAPLPSRTIVAETIHSPAMESVELIDSSAPTPPTKSNHSVSNSVDFPSSTKDSRVTEITQAYKKLQGLKSALDKIVSEVTTLSGVADVDAFEGELRNMKGKTEMSMTEVRRLSEELTEQKNIAEGLKTTHQLELTAQSEQISTLTLQLSEKDSALKLLNTQLSESEAKTKLGEEALVKGVEDYDKLKIVAKEEEEKRVKALSLLRALRQKLVKSEKDKEEVEKERDSLKSSESSIQETIKADRNRFDQEVVSLRAAQESQLSKMRQAFEKEANSIKLQYERETTARKGQYELDAITLKASNFKELSNKEVRIQQLEGKIREMTTSRDSLFDQLQLKTAEIESSSSHQESLSGQTTELKYELKEAKDRAAALKEEVEELRRARRDVTRDDANTRKLLAETEARHELKLKEMINRAKQLEKDRQETELEMGSNLQERMREVERMRQEIIQKDIDYAEATRTRLDRDTKIEEAESARRDLITRLHAAEVMLEHSKEEAILLIQAEAAVREELRERMDRASELESRLEETQIKESTLRSNNKTLRDELRKLQSGVLLSEKQRNPGVGYFAQSSNQNTPTSPTLSEVALSSRRESESGEMLNKGDASTNGEEALNFEYIRNVILQFLEHPGRRTQLVSVLGIILHFTPAETRRLTFGSKQT